MHRAVREGDSHVDVKVHSIAGRRRGAPMSLARTSVGWTRPSSTHAGPGLGGASRGLVRGPVERKRNTACNDAPRVSRIVVVGGAWGGTHMVRNLETLCRRRHDVELVLVSRDNHFLMTPFLFEACSGSIELTHCSVPLRDYLRRTTIRSPETPSSGSSVPTK